jgi:hypothetical protein
MIKIPHSRIQCGETISLFMKNTRREMGGNE